MIVLSREWKRWKNIVGVIEKYERDFLNANKSNLFYVGTLM